MDENLPLKKIIHKVYHNLNENCSQLNAFKENTSKEN
jgi:hypothetical protein